MAVFLRTPLGVWIALCKLLAVPQHVLLSVVDSIFIRFIRQVLDELGVRHNHIASMLRTFGEDTYRSKFSHLVP